MEYESLRSGKKHDLTEEVSCCPTCQWTILHGALWYSWSFLSTLSCPNAVGTSAVYPTVTKLFGSRATTCTKVAVRTSFQKFTWISISERPNFEPWLEGGPVHRTQRFSHWYPKERRLYIRKSVKNIFIITLNNQLTKYSHVFFRTAIPIVLKISVGLFEPVALLLFSVRNQISFRWLCSNRTVTVTLKYTDRHWSALKWIHSIFTSSGGNFRFGPSL